MHDAELRAGREGVATDCTYPPTTVAGFRCASARRELRVDLPFARGR